MRGLYACAYGWLSANTFDLCNALQVFFYHSRYHLSTLKCPIFRALTSCNLSSIILAKYGPNYLSSCSTSIMLYPPQNLAKLPHLWFSLSKLPTLPQSLSGNKMDCPRSKIACCPLCLTRHKTITHLFKAVFYITPERNNETVNIATETANTEPHTHLPDETVNNKLSDPAICLVNCNQYREGIWREKVV